MKKYIGILAKITGFILIVILAVNMILPLIKRNPMQLMKKNWNRLHLRKKRGKRMQSGSDVLMTMKRHFCGDCG